MATAATTTTTKADTEYYVTVAAKVRKAVRVIEDYPKPGGNKINK